MPEWKVVVRKNDSDAWPWDEWSPRGAIGYIEYNGGIAYTAVYIYPTQVEFVCNYGSSGSLKTKSKGKLERGLVLDACHENFLPLLSNRLHMMGLGFKTAVESRERNKHRTDNQRISG